VISSKRAYALTGEPLLHSLIYFLNKWVYTDSKGICNISGVVSVMVKDQVHWEGT
jgi:hypothetical protein